jgi:hypothetical protein
MIGMLRSNLSLHSTALDLAHCALDASRLCIVNSTLLTRVEFGESEHVDKDQYSIASHTLAAFVFHRHGRSGRQLPQLPLCASIRHREALAH